MDLSWCIMCDRHCIEDNLYCSESCRVKDTDFKGPVLVSPPSSPLLDPYFSSFERRPSTSPSIRSPKALFGSSLSSDYSLSGSL